MFDSIIWQRAYLVARNFTHTHSPIDVERCVIMILEIPCNLQASVRNVRNSNLQFTKGWSSVCPRHMLDSIFSRAGSILKSELSSPDNIPNSQNIPFDDALRDGSWWWQLASDGCHQVPVRKRPCFHQGFPMYEHGLHPVDVPWCLMRFHDVLRRVWSLGWS